jgi:hypothetical protein
MKKAPAIAGAFFMVFSDDIRMKWITLSPRPKAACREYHPNRFLDNHRKNRR